jgi:hypothetical protein
MKKYLLFVIFINLIVSGACSSEQPKTNTSNVNAPNANTEINGNVNTNLIPLGNVNNANINTNQVNVIVPKPANQNVKSSLNAAPAPFDSTVTTTMTKDGKFLETRVFKSEPTILKVERMQENKTIKLYLKNGKVVDLPYDKGFNLFTSGSPQDILAAGGIKPAATPVSVNPQKLEETTKDVPKKSP